MTALDGLDVCVCPTKTRLSRCVASTARSIRHFVFGGSLVEATSSSAISVRTSSRQSRCSCSESVASAPTCASAPAVISSKPDAPTAMAQSMLCPTKVARASLLAGVCSGSWVAARSSANRAICISRRAAASCTRRFSASSLENPMAVTMPRGRARQQTRSARPSTAPPALAGSGGGDVEQRPLPPKRVLAVGLGQALEGEGAGSDVGVRPEDQDP